MRDKQKIFIGMIIVMVIVVIFGVIYLMNGGNKDYSDTANEMFEDISTTVVEPEVQDDVVVSDNTVSDPVVTETIREEQPVVTIDEVLASLNSNANDWTQVVALIVYGNKPSDGRTATEVVESLRKYMSIDLYNAASINADYVDNAETLYDQTPPEYTTESGNLTGSYVTIKNENGEPTELITYDEYITRFGTEPPLSDVIDLSEVEEEESPTASSVTFSYVTAVDKESATITVNVDGVDTTYKVVFEGDKVCGFQ